MFDLISIGDTVIDTVIPLEEAEVVTREKDNSLLLALPFGAKLPVGSGESMVAGNAANNAVGSARLGLKTAIYTHSGSKDDEEDDLRIYQKFKKEKVDTRYVVEVKDLPSNHNVVLSYKGERTILVHHQPWKFNLPDLEKTKWIYLTSMSSSYVQSSIIDQLINYIERSGARLAYQPGTFQVMQGVKKQARLLSLCEVLVMNLQEAKMFLGYSNNEKIPVKKLLKGLSNLGINKIVITDGTEGSYGFDGETYWGLEVFPAKLVEMTGAGDAYATAMIAGFFYGEPLANAMRWGAANSAAVVEAVGPQRGLLNLEQIQERLNDNKIIQTKEI